MKLRIDGAQGWTLVELMVVLVIVSIVSAGVVWRIRAWQRQHDRLAWQSIRLAWQDLSWRVTRQSTWVDCRLEGRGWHCWQWQAQSPTQVAWQPLTFKPWWRDGVLPEGWRWVGVTRLRFYPDGTVRPRRMVFCQQRRCHTMSYKRGRWHDSFKSG